MAVKKIAYDQEARERIRLFALVNDVGKEEPFHE